MKLIGFIDGIEVSFDFYPPSTFKGYIPKTINGRYVLQLKVVDNAGNEESISDVYVYVDFKNMHFRVLDSNFKFNIDTNDFNYRKIDSEFSYRELVPR